MCDKATKDTIWVSSMGIFCSFKALEWCGVRPVEGRYFVSHKDTKMSLLPDGHLIHLNAIQTEMVIL